jgi:hypothetical protein
MLCRTQQMPSSFSPPARQEDFESTRTARRFSFRFLNLAHPKIQLPRHFKRAKRGPLPMCTDRVLLLAACPTPATPRGFSHPTPLPWHLPTGIPTRARAAPRDPHARERSRQRATHSMPSYPRHRASHFRSHMNIIPTRLHGLCDAFSSASRLSSPHSPDFAFPPSRRTNYLKNA